MPTWVLIWMWWDVVQVELPLLIQQLKALIG